ncbi:MAG TPA: ABC transporter ATP-binding protein, partial [Tepidisphaeraceae bacterium]|nr:ABC transporter ATP-binding protein [Tepidisphaeraceae bacterium]
VVHPSCLLLDEPLSNLDTKLRIEMRSEIRRICRSAHLTAIYVTHDQKEALSIADRMAVLNVGKIEQVGAPQELYLHPKNKFVAAFMGETNFIDGTVTDVSQNRVIVMTSLGKITSAANGAEIKAGEKLTLSIRPEVLRLGEAPANAVNQFDGLLHDTVYFGEYAQHQVDIANNGQPASGVLQVSELNPRLLARDQTIEQAKIWFEPSDVVLLKE